jgi:hypothetical protein
MQKRTDWKWYFKMAPSHWFLSLKRTHTNTNSRTPLEQEPWVVKTFLHPLCLECIGRNFQGTSKGIFMLSNRFLLLFWRGYGAREYLSMSESPFAFLAKKIGQFLMLAHWILRMDCQYIFEFSSLECILRCTQN